MKISGQLNLTTKRLLGVSIVGILLFSSCSKNNPSPFIQVPLVNTDMESGSTQPASWYFGHTAVDIAMTWATDAASSPSHSLEMSRSVVTDATSFAAWGQNYPGTIPFGKDLIFAVKINGVNLSGQGLSIAIRVDGVTTPDLQFSTTQNSLFIGGTFDWKTYTVKLNSVNGQAKYIIVYLVYLPTTTGKAYFDDVSLTHN